MKRRDIFLAVVVIFLALGLWLAFRSEPPPIEIQPVPAGPAIAQNGGTPLARPVLSGAPNRPANSVVDSPEREQAMIEIDKVRHMITDFHTLMKENPVGTNAEIMKVVMGANPREAKLGPPEGQTLNAKGELIDQWGTPYFFHQLSSDHMEIHSAGPDKVLGTVDDLVIQ